MDNHYRKPFKTVTIRTDDIPRKPRVPAFVLRHTGIESINVERRGRHRDGYPFYKFRCAMHELPVYRVKFITNEVLTKCCFSNTYGTVQCECIEAHALQRDPAPESASDSESASERDSDSESASERDSDSESASERDSDSESASERDSDSESASERDSDSESASERYSGSERDSDPESAASVNSPEEGHLANMSRRDSDAQQMNQSRIVRERARRMVELAEQYEHDMMEINRLMNAEEQRHEQAMQAFRQRRNQLTENFANMQPDDEEE